ncbi:MAG: DNA polymerase III subunit delta [Dehalococcoidia bacterium]
MIVVLFGANELAMRRRLQELKDEADGGSGMLVTNMTTVDGRDAKVGDVLGPCMAPPFLAPRRLVIVEHLLERYESRGGRGARALGPWEQLTEELAKGIPETTTLVFFGQPFLVEGRQRTVGKTNPLVAALAKVPGVSIEEHPALEKENLLRYIVEEGALRGLRFKRGGGDFESHEERPPENDPVQLLANLLQGDTLSIANELDKLALYTRDAGGEVTVADVNRVSHGDRQLKSWDLTDALINCQLGPALYALQTLEDSGEALQGLLALIMARYRSLAPVVELAAEGLAAPAIAEQLKRPNNYPLQKDVAAAKRYSPATIKIAYQYLVEADRTHKAGEVDEDVSLDLLVMKLCSLAPPYADRRR